MNDDDQDSDWMSANEAARSGSVTSLSGSIAYNDDTASSPAKRPVDQWEPEEIIDDDHIEPDTLASEILNQEAADEDTPFTIPPPPSQHHYQPENTTITAEEEEEEEHLPPAPTSTQQPTLPPADQPSLSRPSGASLFSVPPSSAPHSGVYDMPLEAFEFRDLDSGRTFYLDKRYWIKDVDTGKVYVLEPEEQQQNQEGIGGGTGTGASRVSSGDGRAPSASSLRVSELLSGQELSLEEFENVLGYFREPPERPENVASPDSDEDEEEEEKDLAAQAQLIAQRGLHSLSLGTCRFFLL
jgi:hypothetical protein